MKKLLCIILSLNLLCGCSLINNLNSVTGFSSEEGSKYISQLKNFTNCEKNINNSVDNEEFNEFLDEIFIDGLKNDYLSTAYIVKDYKEYGIDKPELSIGEIVYNDTSAANECIDYLNKLDTFDTTTLSYRQQYDYDCLKYSLLETIALDYYDDLTTIFSMSSNICDTLITNFTEFTFYNSEQVDDYLVLLQDVDRYLDDALSYTNTQINNGIYISDNNLDYVIDFNKDFISKTDYNELIISFNNSIDSLDFLTNEEKETYKNKNKQIVLDEVIPAYEKVNNELNNYYGLFDYSNGSLVNISSEYSELCYLLNGSNNYSIDSTFELLEDTWNDLANNYLEGLDSTSAYSEYESLYENYGFLKNYSDEDIIDYHIKNYTKSFPALNNIKYTVSDLDPTVASDTILAYYVQSRIDDLENNIIKVNPNTTGDDKVSSYYVLAHEGIPGHLYQHNYYWSLNPHPFRSMQNFSAYSEGFAVYAQDLSTSWFDTDNLETKYLINFDNLYYFILYSMIDIGVNYYGWSSNDLYKYLKNIGLNVNESMSQTYYELMIDMPGVYCTYGIGYSYFMELRNTAKEKVGDNYDDPTFNEYLLKNGPLPFNILNDCVNEYVNKYANQ